MDLFLFGTLRHLPLLEVVAGAALTPRVAMLDGYQVAGVQGQPFPQLQESPGALAEGLLLVDLPADALARIDYYEAAFGYTRHAITLADGAAAHVYLPAPGLWQAEGLWDIDQWARDWGALTVDTARDAMELMQDGVPPEVMGRRYPQIMVRALSRQRARENPVRAGLNASSDVTLHEVRRPYMHFFAVEEVDLSFRRFDGDMSDVVERAVWVAGDAALVLPYDPRRDRVLLIEQFRPGPYRRADPNPWLMEPIAGRIDPGESAEDAARREAVEEAGITLGALHLVSSGYPSPGGTTEYYEIFIGLTDLPDGVDGIGGKLSEAEDIRSHLLDWAAFDAQLCANGYRLTPLELAGHWLARNRERLRASA